MSKPYTIIINNDSGNEVTYAFFNEAPVVSGSASSDVWPNVLATALAEPGLEVMFTVVPTFYATCGNVQGNIAAGMQVIVKESLPMTLGSKKADGSEVPGSTFNLKVANHETPFFNPTSPPNSGFENSFAVVTSDDFNADDAKTHNFFIGYSLSNVSGDKVPAATFLPGPDLTYQITPSNTFYVGWGTHTSGTLVDISTFGKPVAVDFNKYPSTVKIKHADTGDLQIQTEAQ